MKMSMKELIRFNLNDLMTRGGYKNTELAQGVSVTKAAVSNWRNGTNSVDIELLPRMSDFFGVPLEFFFRLPDVDYSNGVEEKMDGESCEEYCERVQGQPLPGTYSPDERELVRLYRAMSAKNRVMLTEIAREFASKGEEQAADSRGSLQSA